MSFSKRHDGHGIVKCYARRNVDNGQLTDSFTKYKTSFFRGYIKSTELWKRSAALSDYSFFTNETVTYFEGKPNLTN